jgi:hypothetical protein
MCTTDDAPGRTGSGSTGCPNSPAGAGLEPAAPGQDGPA